MGNKRKLASFIKAVLKSKQPSMIEKVLHALKFSYGITLRDVGHANEIVNTVIRYYNQRLDVIIPLMIDTYFLDPSKVSVSEKSLAGESKSHIRKVMEGLTYPAVEVNQLKYLSQWFDITFHDVHNVVLMYFNPEQNVDEDDLVYLGESLLNVFVDNNIVEKLVDRPVLPWNGGIGKPNDVLQDSFADFFHNYAKRAYLFFGKMLQLRMLAEISHIPSADYLAPVKKLSGFASLDLMFEHLTLYDVEDFLNDENTKRISLYTTGGNIDLNRIQNFIQPYMSLLKENSSLYTSR
eukprot:317176-Pleurochrysis_carterae.AAC.1